MAEPFDVTLPAVGAKPWTLNPAVQEIRQRIRVFEDAAVDNQAAISSTTFVVDSKKYAVDPSGGTDSTSGLISAFNATPDGATTVLPRGTYTISGNQSLQLGSKTVVDIDGQGSTIRITGGTAPFLDVTGSFETVYDVSGVTATTVNTGSNSETPAITFTSSSTTGWERGDVVRIIAENELPSSRSSDFTSVGSFSTTSGSSQVTLPGDTLVGHAVRFPAGTTAFTPLRDYYVVSNLGGGGYEISTTLSGAPVNALATSSGTVSRSTAFQRVGQFVKVWSVSGTSVTALGVLHGDFTLSPRASRMTRKTVRLRNVTFDLSVERRSVATNIIKMSRLFNPVVENVTVPRAAGPVVDISCSFNPVSSVHVFQNTNDATSGVYGYGIIYSACSFAEVRDSTFGNLRHGVTGDTIETSMGAAPHRYGANMFTLMRDSVADGCSLAAFDTHHGSFADQWSNLTVTASGGAIAVRGLRGVATDIKAYDCDIDVNVFEEGPSSGQPRNGDTRCFTLNGLVSHRNRKYVIYSNKAPSGNWDAGVIKTQNDHYSNVRSYGHKGLLVYTVNCSATFGDIYAEDTEAHPGGRWWWANNSLHKLSGPVTVDASRQIAAANSGLLGFTVSGAGVLDFLQPVRVFNVSGVPSILYSASGSLTTIRAEDTIVSTVGGLTALSGTVASGSYVNYKETSTSGRSGAWTSVSSAHTNASSYSAIGTTTELVQQLNISGLTANTDAGSLLPTPPRIGQMLAIFNTSSSWTFTINGVTIPTSTMYLLRYTSSGLGWRKVSS